ncbi:MAG TPA: type II toxin-antitoxin system VapC family toxin [Bryobacteraceae bacterium]|jgi:predicted nucleic-acid-binding protein|nr:type II toxin-antitoxin system VapC family toxin [Bryobacteraceae bacterium]
MRAVDTNVLVRLITRDDQDQTASAENFVSKGAWVSAIALTEAIWALASVYDVGSAGQATAVEMLLNHRDLTIHDREIVAAALARFRSRPTLGFSDCLILEMARKAGHLPLGTFDRNLGRVAGAQRL